MWETIAAIVGAIVLLGFCIMMFYVSKKNLKKNMLKSIANGENVLNLILTKRNGFLIKDYSYVSEKKSKEKIDYIFISKRGVHLLKVKSFNGDISGHENDEIWECIPKNGKKVTFTNPTKYVDEEIKVLKNILGEDVKIKPYIVFVSSTTNKLYSKISVTQDKLMEILDAGDKVYTNKEINEFNEKLTIKN